MRYSFLIVMLSVLGACTTLRQPVDIDAMYWGLEGKLSIQTAGQSRIVSIDWNQQGDSSEIRLKGPLGSGEVKVQVVDQRLLVHSGGDTHEYPLDRGLEIEGVSFRLPWKHLAYWVRGFQGPDMEPVDGGYSEDGWTFRVLDSSDAGPVLIDLNHPEVRLRLKVRQWRQGGH